MGSLSRETDLLSPQPWTTLDFGVLHGLREEHWKCEPEILQTLTSDNRLLEPVKTDYCQNEENPEVNYTDSGWVAQFSLCETLLPLDSLGLLELWNNSFHFLLFSSQNLYLHGQEPLFSVFISRADVSLHHCPESCSLRCPRGRLKMAIKSLLILSLSSGPSSFPLEPDLALGPDWPIGCSGSDALRLWC